MTIKIMIKSLRRDKIMNKSLKKFVLVLMFLVGFVAQGKVEITQIWKYNKDLNSVGAISALGEKTFVCVGSLGLYIFPKSPIKAFSVEDVAKGTALSEELIAEWREPDQDISVIWLNYGKEENKRAYVIYNVGEGWICPAVINSGHLLIPSAIAACEPSPLILEYVDKRTGTIVKSAFMTLGFSAAYKQVTPD